MLSQEDQEMMMMIKGKRSKRPRPTSSLALFTVSTTSTTTSTTSSPLNSDGEEEEEGHHRHRQGHREDIEEDMANCLILLAKGRNPNKPIIAASSSSNPENISYQCKTCSKSFSSFQALGGHRASHKDRSSISRDQENPRDDYDRSVILSLQMSSRVDLNGDPNDCKYSNAKKSSRVHECSICGAEFASGQALGGHMRRHRAVPPAGAGGGESKRPRNLLALDLNLPAPEDRDRKVAFVPKEQVIAFSASSLVDCLY